MTSGVPNRLEMMVQSSVPELSNVGTLMAYRVEPLAFTIGLTT